MSGLCRRVSPNRKESNVSLAKIFPHPYKSKKEKFTIEELSESMLDGHDYERGSVETAQAAADNVAKAFGRLMK